MRLIQLLMGLNEVYTIVRGSILMMNPLPSLAHVFSLLVHNENKERLGQPTNCPFSQLYWMWMHHDKVHSGRISRQITITMAILELDSYVISARSQGIVRRDATSYMTTHRMFRTLVETLLAGIFQMARTMAKTLDTINANEQLQVYKEPLMKVWSLRKIKINPKMMERMWFWLKNNMGTCEPTSTILCWKWRHCEIPKKFKFL